MKRCLVALLLLMCGDGFAASDGPALSVDAGANRHPISPDIYGINDFSDSGLADSVRIGVKRWGGDASTRYNWLNDTYNAAGDWYFTNFAYSDTNPAALPDGSSFDRFVEGNLLAGAKSLGTIPMIGWLPKSRDLTCGFSISKYGPQQMTEPYHPDCGNGVKPDGKTKVTGNDPTDTSQQHDETFAQQWVQHLIARYGKANRGGVKLWSLDNEPEWWMGVHIDVHPAPATYDEVTNLGIRYAAAVKSIDPSAQITGPVPSGWMAYFYSGADFVAGWSSHSPWNYDTNPLDRLAHGNIPWVEYYLQQMAKYDQQHGMRLLDYLDVHGYVTPANVGFGSAGGASNPGLDTLRLVSTRALWDPNYQFSDPVINAPPNLIPRMRDWVARNYPGTKLAITEYNWGALDDITGAIAQADIFGIFGREGLDLGTLWAPPTPTQPGAYAFRMYLNYDGMGGQFGETSVSATTADPDQLPIFAAQRSDGALTLMVLNKTLSDLNSTIAIANFDFAPNAQVYLYSAAKLDGIVRQSDVAVTSSGVEMTFPARSITLLVIPQSAGSQPVPKPTVLAVKNAASWSGGAVAPGEIVVIGGTNLAQAALETGGLTADGGYLSTSAGGVRVLFDGVPAPLIYTSQNQLSAIVPYEAGLAAMTHIQVEYQGVRSDPFPVAVAAAAPGLFAADSSGSGQGAIIDSDQQPNTSAHPASRGDVVVLYATGEGATSSPGVDGRLALDLLPHPVQPCTVSIGGAPADVLYCGAAPGFTAGLMQINARVPLSITPGPAVGVQLSIGGVASQSGVTLAIQ